MELYALYAQRILVTLCTHTWGISITSSLLEINSRHLNIMLWSFITGQTSYHIALFNIHDSLTLSSCSLSSPHIHCYSIRYDLLSFFYLILSLVNQVIILSCYSFAFLYFYCCNFTFYLVILHSSRNYVFLIFVWLKNILFLLCYQRTLTFKSSSTRLGRA